MSMQQNVYACIFMLLYLTLSSKALSLTIMVCCVSLGIWTLNLQACYPCLWRSQACRYHLNKFSQTTFIFFTLWMYSCLSVQDHLLGKTRLERICWDHSVSEVAFFSELMFSVVLKTVVVLAVISCEWKAVLLPGYNQLIKGQLS